MDRTQYIGGSEVAALFNEHKFLSPYKLYMLKTGVIKRDKTNERMEAGNYLEPAIAKMWADRNGAELMDFSSQSERIKDGLGGHIDYMTTDMRIVECKNIDHYHFQEWGDEPPIMYLLQAQAYLLLWPEARCVEFAVLVGGNTLQQWTYERHSIASQIMPRVKQFWDMVESKQPYQPDLERDCEAVKEYYASIKTDTEADATDNNRLPYAVSRYKRLGKVISKLDKLRDQYQAEINIIAGESKKVKFNGGLLSFTYVQPTIIERQERKGYYRMSIKEDK